MGGGGVRLYTAESVVSTCTLKLKNRKDKYDGKKNDNFSGRCGCQPLERRGGCGNVYCLNNRVRCAKWVFFPSPPHKCAALCWTTWVEEAPEHLLLHKRYSRGSMPSRGVCGEHAKEHFISNATLLFPRSLFFSPPLYSSLFVDFVFLLDNYW